MPGKRGRGRGRGGKRGGRRGRGRGRGNGRIHPQGMAIGMSVQNNDGYYDEETGQVQKAGSGFYKCLVKFGLISGFLFGTISLGLSISAFIRLSAFESDFENIIDTWQAQPIQTVALQIGGCSLSAIDASTFTWSGTYDMCDCTCCNNCTSATLTTTSGCSTSDIVNECRDIPGIDSVEFTVLPNNTYLCYESSGTSAIDRPLPKNDQTCPNGYQYCGSADTYEFCADDNEDCPITDLIFYDANDTTLSNEADEILPAFEVDSTQMNLYVKRGGAFSLTGEQRTASTDEDVGAVDLIGHPLVELRVSRAIPCYLKEGLGHSGRSSEYATMESNFALNVSDDFISYDGFFCPSYSTGYILKTRESGCSREYDDRFVTTLTAGERALFTSQSSIPKEYITSSNEYNLHVVLQTETRWSDKASNECPDREQVLKNEDEVNDLMTAQTILMTFTIITFIAIVAVGGYLQYKWVGTDDDGKIEKGEPNYNKLRNLKIAKYSFKTICLTCTVASIILAQGVLYLFSAIEDGNNCSDRLSLKTFNTLGAIIRKISMEDILNSVSNLGDVGFDFLKDCLAKSILG